MDHKTFSIPPTDLCPQQKQTLNFVYFFKKQEFLQCLAMEFWIYFKYTYFLRKHRSQWLKELFSQLGKIHTYLSFKLAFVYNQTQLLSLP